MIPTRNSFAPLEDADTFDSTEAGGCDSTPQTQSSSDSGGGSSDHPVVDMITATPPRPSHEGADHLQSECFSDCQSSNNQYTFSAKTCLELLKRGVLTDEQLEFERERLSMFNIKIARPSKDINDQYRNIILTALENELNIHNCSDHKLLLKKLNELTSFVSYTTEQVESLRRRVLPTPPASAQRTGFSTPTRHPPPAPPARENRLNTTAQPQSPLPLPDLEPEVKLNKSVCCLLDPKTINFSDLSVDEILKELKVETRATHGNRRIAYYGTTPYKNGTVRHEATEYPHSHTFDTLFSRMRNVIPDFTPSNYTCLVTLYPDGNSFIKFHNDSAQIVPNSTIYTVSVGCDRTAIFQNQVGIINESKVKIPHGSVYSMSSESQVTWKHSIPVDPAATGPRISFTFRKLKSESDMPKRPQAPPICHPDKYSGPRTQPQGTHSGILLLTDSILSQTPEHIFNRIPGHRLIKKENKCLVDIMSFEPEFKYRKAVVFSCGVNDLSCYGFRGHTLSGVMGPKIADACKKHSSTSFIFNSILYTRHDWLNSEIDTMNMAMFELSMTLPNLY